MTAQVMLALALHLGPLTVPGPRALEAALAAAFGAIALVLRSSRRSPVPGLTQAARTVRASARWRVPAFTLRRPNPREAFWALLGGVAAAAFVGGDLAIPAGILGAGATLVSLFRQRAKAAALRRARLSMQIPPLADLFAAALSAGLQPGQAAMTVAEAFGSNGTAHTPDLTAVIRGPTGTASARSGISDVEMLACRFYDAAEALLAGADAEAAWSALAEDEATAPLAAAVIRAGRTGAPAAAAVGRAARELRDVAADALTIEVRAVGVRATAPLAVCFLPAFVLLGVLPTALGLLPRLRG